MKTSFNFSLQKTSNAKSVNKKRDLNLNEQEFLFPFFFNVLSNITNYSSFYIRDNNSSSYTSLSSIAPEKQKWPKGSF